MSDFEVSSRLKWEAEGAEQAAKAVAAIGDASTDSGKDFDRLNAAAKNAASSLKAIDAGGAIRAATDQVDQLGRSLDDVAAKAGRTGRSFDALGATGRITQRFGMLSAGLGASELAAPLMFANDLADAAEVLPLASEGIRAMGDSAKALPGILGTVATSAATAAGGLGATAASLAAIAAPIAAVVAPVAALGVAVAVLGAQAEAGRDQITAFFTKEEQDMLRRIEIQEQAASLTSEQLDAEQTALGIRRQIMEQELVDRAANVEAMRAKGREMGITEEGLAYFTPLTDAKAAFDKLNQSLIDLRVVEGENEQIIRPLVEAREAETAAMAAQERAMTEATRNRLSELDAQRQESVEMARLIREGSAEQIRARVEALQDERRAIQAEMIMLRQAPEFTSEAGQAKYAELNAALEKNIRSAGRLTDEVLPLVDAREKETAAIERQRETIQAGVKAYEESTRVAEDLQQAEADYADVLEKRRVADQRAGAEAQLTSRIEAARARERASNAGKVQEDAQREDLKALTSHHDSVGKLNAEFMASELKATQAFQIAESRATEDYDRERVRQLEDMNTALVDLAAKGDVAGFISRQAQGNLQLERGAEDAGVAGKRRVEDFTAERRAAIDEQQTRLADLVTSYQNERAQRQQQLADRLQQEREAGRQQLTESAQLEKELANLRASWAQADKAAQRALEDREHQKNLAALKNRQAQLSPIIQSAIEPARIAVQNWGASATNYLNKLAQAVQAAASKVVVTKAAGGGGFRNAEGGIYSSPTIAELGEKPGWVDWVIPMRQSEGFTNALKRLTGGMAGSQPITVNIPGMQVGELVSPSQLQEFGQVLKQNVFSGVTEALRAAKGVTLAGA